MGNCAVHYDLANAIAFLDAYRMEGRPAGSTDSTVSVDGEFTTAAAADVPAPVRFTVVTGSRWQTRDDLRNGQKIYPQMAALKPSFFVHTGDIVYYDSGEPVCDAHRLGPTQVESHVCLAVLAGIPSTGPQLLHQG